MFFLSLYIEIQKNNANVLKFIVTKQITIVKKIFIRLKKFIQVKQYF